MNIQRKMKTGDIVTQFPKANQLFKKYRIDFCCSGNQPIADAIQQLNLDEGKVLSELQSLYDASIAMQNKEVDWTQAEYSELIDYIVQAHHAYLYETLPELSQFITKVYRVHGHHRPELSEVHHLFHKLKAELEHHLIQEEEHIFPKIKAFDQSASLLDLENATQAIDQLEKEHETCGHLLKELRHVTDDYTPPEGACMTYQLTYRKLDELETDLFRHIHLENHILFPRLLAE
ncbi:iron-sulfur cluster repair di-iron protein [Halalkalibacterium halodurans]|nr:iron-sulfur cluster repair di-iron protein [Halalkalibacterium halodurans]MDY7220748.1 iron-sulfur cluster repair di-iron protein [Halalkalibacterium halodurans]MDY7239987.1 iron-sulfur cluster repair di-iron protein [Halalkalibacterium halodurans]MED4163108.1 iron-sulfur cluster repair di-iron protein [Halalkalibacterium halodurans]